VNKVPACSCQKLCHVICKTSTFWLSETSFLCPGLWRQKHGHPLLHWWEWWIGVRGLGRRSETNLPRHGKFDQREVSYIHHYLSVLFSSKIRQSHAVTYQSLLFRSEDWRRRKIGERGRCRSRAGSTGSAFRLLLSSWRSENGSWQAHQY
jgi:hypothetical protein